MHKTADVGTSLTLYYRGLPRVGTKIHTGAYHGGGVNLGYFRSISAVIETACFNERGLNIVSALLTFILI